MRRGPRLTPEELAPYLLTVAPAFQPDDPQVRLESRTDSPLDWRDIFGNDHPVELEVGFGKGLFLLTAAQAHPEVNFVGVEIVRKYQLFTATRLAKRGLGNVRVACADVLQFLPAPRSDGVVASRPRVFSRSVVEEAPSQTPYFHRGVRGRVRARPAAAWTVTRRSPTWRNTLR